MSTPSLTARWLAGRTRHTRWLGFLLAPLLAVSAPSEAWPEWVREFFEMLGIAALLACFVGRIWSSIYVGGRKGVALVTIGPYSLVRNPLYVSSFLGVVGVFSLGGMIVPLVVAMLIFALYYRMVVAQEETHLAATHGEAFADYAARVPRWIPSLRHYQDVETLEVRPHVIIAHLRDGSVFFVAFLLFETVQMLQASGILPVLLRIP